MKIFNYEIKKVNSEEDVKIVMLNKAELNAKTGVIQATLELRHHSFLLEQLENKLPTDLEKKEQLEKEITLIKEAIERDERSINNWQTQLKAINYERNN